MSNVVSALELPRFPKWRSLAHLCGFVVATGLIAAPAPASEFRLLVGHGGPVMSAAVSSDGRRALTGSFDNSVGLWTLGSEEVTWLEGHEAAVKSALRSAATQISRAIVRGVLGGLKR